MRARRCRSSRPMQASSRAGRTRSIGLFGAGWDVRRVYRPARRQPQLPAGRRRSDDAEPARHRVKNQARLLQGFRGELRGQPPDAGGVVRQRMGRQTSPPSPPSRRGSSVRSSGLRSAEAMATIVALRNPAFMTPRIAARDDAFRDFGLIIRMQQRRGSSGSVPCPRRLSRGENPQTYLRSKVRSTPGPSSIALIPAVSETTRVFIQRVASFRFRRRSEMHHPGIDICMSSNVAIGADVPTEPFDFGQHPAASSRSAMPASGYKMYFALASAHRFARSDVNSSPRASATFKSSYYNAARCGSRRHSSLLDRKIFHR